MKGSIQQIDPLSKWHRWWAWHSVAVSRDKFILFDYVERMASSASYDGYGGYIWIYRETGSNSKGICECDAGRIRGFFKDYNWPWAAFMATAFIMMAGLSVYIAYKEEAAISIYEDENAR